MQAKTIYLVLENLNIHCRKSLTDLAGAEFGSEIWERFTISLHLTHGSWRDQAEIEIGMFTRQCLGRRRILTLPGYARQSRAGNRCVNADRTTIKWRFDRKAARRKFGYKRHFFTQ